MNRIGALVVLLAMFWVGAWNAEGASRPEPIQFNRDVRPILSDKCFHCHGPDANKRAAKLRLDEREEALAKKAFVPGHPEQSEILRRITTTDEDDHMPPAKSKLPSLTVDETKVLTRWIAEGAKYEKHWAFNPLRPATVPKVKGAMPLDAFVSARLAEKKLKPQPEADRATLIRRVTFDLTGLPPTPAEIEAFVNDKTSKAFETVVDRLLRSERFGERMAVDWLDVARYADSYGFQVDREREMWPWRDWVIRAFNQNLPFDQFITWQVAGDLLPNATDDQILATAFNRLHQQETEGGSVEEEYRVEYVADRVQTFSTAFLGLTMECSRCHDHKFDPIMQKEYYGLFAFLQNIDEAGLYSYYTDSPPTPTLMQMDAPAKERLAALRKSVTDLERVDAEARANQSVEFSNWLKARPAEMKIPNEIGRFNFDVLGPTNRFANAVATNFAKLNGENKLVPGRAGNAVQFTGDDSVALSFGNFRSYEPFSVGFWMKTPDRKDRAVVFHRSKSWTDAASRGYELLIEDGKLKWSLIHFWPGNAISIRAKSEAATNEWMHVAVSSDGSGRAAGLRLYVNGEAAEIEVVKDNLSKDITGGGGDEIHLGERDRDRGFKGGVIDDFRVFARALSPLEMRSLAEPEFAQTLLARAEGELSVAERELLSEWHRAAFDVEAGKRAETLKGARAEALKFADGIKEIMVMRELSKPKKAYVLFRGEYNQRREEAPAVVPEWLLPFPKGAPTNRLGLAQWLTSREHPLTARVSVNRFWQSLFGRGLVKTAEDFGSQGSRPLYPELLDWLALKFMDSGWDTKALIKTMVLSQTYRQRSITDAKQMADDPENEWLARGPRFRLPAEMVRDNALAAAGLLAPEVGGPPVNPYEMIEAFKPAKVSEGNGAYRRSLYTTWRRTSPPPAMVAFDAPRRAVCIARRERTDSPLQALILLNGVQYVEAARALGEKLFQDNQGNLEAMIEQGFLRCLSRKPDSVERKITTQLYREQLAWFQAKPDEAEKFLKVGRAARDPKISAPEAAAATALAQALLNHDSSLVKR